MNSVFQSFAWQFFSRGLVILLKIVLLIFLSRQLGPIDFGISNFSYSVATLLVNICVIGIGGGLIQQKVLTKQNITAAFFTYLALGVILATSVWSLAKPICNLFNIQEAATALQWSALIPLASSIGATSYHILMKELRFKEIAKIDFINFLVINFLGSIILIKFTSNFWTLVLPTILYTIIVNAFYIIRAPIILNLEFKKNDFTFLLKFGSYNFLASLFNTLGKQVDVFLISKYLGSASLGIYNRAMSLMTVNITLLGEVIDRTLFPLFSKFKDDKSKTLRYYKLSIYLVNISVLPIVIFLFFSAENIIIIFLGSNWSDSIIVFQLLCLSILPRLNYKIGHQFLKSLGLVKAAYKNQLIFFLFMLLLSLFLVKYKLIGISVATTISLLLLNILTNISLYRSKEFEGNFKEILEDNLYTYLLCFILLISLVILKYTLISNFLFLSLSSLGLLLTYLLLLFSKKTQTLVKDLQLTFIIKIITKLRKIR